MSRWLTVITCIGILFILSGSAWAAGDEDLSIRSNDDEWAAEQEYDKIAGIYAGYHRHSLDAYRWQMDWVNSALGSWGVGSMGQLEGSNLQGELLVGYRKDHHALIFSLGGFTEVKAEEHYNNGEKGSTTINANYFNITYRYYFLPKRYFKQNTLAGLILPYIGAGGGYYQIYYTFYDPETGWDIPGMGFVNNISIGKDTFGYHVVAGVDHYINQRWSLSLQGGYLWADTTGFEVQRKTTGDTIYYTTIGFGGREIDLKLDGPTIGLSLNYHWH